MPLQSLLYIVLVSICTQISPHHFDVLYIVLCVIHSVYSHMGPFWSYRHASDLLLGPTKVRFVIDQPCTHTLHWGTIDLACTCTCIVFHAATCEVWCSVSPSYYCRIPRLGKERSFLANWAALERTVIVKKVPDWNSMYFILATVLHYTYSVHPFRVISSIRQSSVPATISRAWP